MTLTDFLLARIAEDEEAARAAGGEQWYPFEVPPLSMRKREDDETYICIDSPRTLIASEVVSDEMAQHIVSHDPARVLAECEAKRRIVETSQRTQESLERRGPGNPASDAINGHVLAYRDVVRTLASVYADHPDFRPEWSVR